jgi:hydroxyacylglutathione hydrolase
MAVRTEPANKAARAKLQAVRALRAQKLPSVPSTMAEELAYNPWMKATPVNLAMLCGCGPMAG